MKTFPAIFKSVYDEALLDLGFKRAKGRHLYYIRMVGDEIAHIITYTNEQNTSVFGFKSAKAFAVRGGVATVYRKRLTLDQSPWSNAIWLNTSARFYALWHQGEIDRKYLESIREFGYNKDVESSMYAAVGDSLEAVKQTILPVLDELRDLRKCLDYFYKQEGFVCICPSAFMGDGWEEIGNEGILTLKEYSVDEYIQKEYAKQKARRAEWEDMRRDGLTGMSQEELETFLLDIENDIKEDIKIFKDLINNVDKFTKVKIELENRKKQNTELLNSLMR